MKGIRIFLIVLMLPILACCQEKKLTMGLTFAPSSYIIQSKVLHEYNSRIGFRGGVDLSYHFSERSALSTGVYYSKIRYQIDYYYLYPPPSDPAILKSSDITAGYIDIPFIYTSSKVRSDNSRYMIYFSTGIISSFLISSHDKTTYQDNSVHSSGLLNSSLLSIPIEDGLYYNFNKTLGIKFGAQFRLFLNGIDKRMNQHPVGVCFTLGVVF